MVVELGVFMLARTLTLIIGSSLNLRLFCCVNFELMQDISCGPSYWFDCVDVEAGFRLTGPRILLIIMFLYLSRRTSNSFDDCDHGATYI